MTGMALFLFLRGAVALTPADLCGRWTLDRAASGSVDALLSATGASWPERVVAGSMDVTQTIHIEGDNLIIAVQSALKDSTETLPLDGAPQTRAARNGDQLVIRTREESDSVTTETEITSSDGAHSRLTIRRTLADGGQTLHQLLIYQPAEGPALSADRIFRRSK